LFFYVNYFLFFSTHLLGGVFSFFFYLLVVALSVIMPVCALAWGWALRQITISPQTQLGAYREPNTSILSIYFIILFSPSTHYVKEEDKS
jgi:hypothetical protein